MLVALPVLAAALATGLALAAPTDTCARFSTVAKGVRQRTVPEGALLVRSKREVAARLAGRLDADERRRVAAVDFRRHVVAAAFVTLPTPCHPFEVARVARRRAALVVKVVVEAPPPGTICAQVISTGYHVVKVRRSALGRPLPRRVVLETSGSRLEGSSYR